MTAHLDTLRAWLSSLPCGRLCGCKGCRRREALTEAIRVMEREETDAKAVREYEAALLRGSVDAQTEGFGGEPW